VTRLVGRALLAGLLTSSLLTAPGTSGAATAGAGDDRRPVAVVTHGGEVEARRLTERQLQGLAAEPGAVVARGRAAAPALAQSVPKVGAPTYWGMGHRGAGEVIAVIDTGVASTFGGTIVGQACFAASLVGDDLVGHCGPSRDVTEAFDSTCFTLDVCGPGKVLDPSAGRPCDEPAVPRDCAHGTAVAAVAARHDAPPGVAPDAGVYAIQVFDPTGRRADFVDILLALDHVVDLADAGLEVAAANLSLASSDVHQLACDAGTHPDSDAVAFRTLFQQLIARGIAPIVATGNDAKTASVGVPACVSNAIAVGASDLDDHIADFGNRGPLVDLVAPGADEGNGAVNEMEIPGSPVATWSGTSFSAPHVAGAFALVGDEYPLGSVLQLLDHLRRTGAPATDLDTGARYPRLRLLTPAQALPAGLLFPTDGGVAGTARGAVGDFDGDGFGDVLAHAPGSATDRISYGRGRWSLVPRSYPVAGSYLPIVGNFREGPADDILWYAPGPAADRLWIGRPTRSFGSVAASVAGTYVPLVGDYDGDGYDDIAWYAPGPTKDALWYGGPAGFTPRAMSIAGTYRPAVGDLNGDDRSDLVLHGTGSTKDILWLGTSTRGGWQPSSLVIGGTKVLRTGDLDGDGDDDLLLYEAGGGADAIWRGGPAVGSGGATGGFSPLAVSVNGTYQPSVADLDGDGRDDILWYAPGPTADHLWLGQPAGAPTSRAFSVSGTYVPLLADLDGTAGADVVWFQSRTPTTPIWYSHP
jgi:hypothetical protein